jgi:hypothetical protein
VYRADDATLVGHTGGCPGYFSVFSLHPESKLAFIVLSNAIGTETSLYANMGFELVGPSVNAALEDPDGVPERGPDLDRYAGIYKSAWGQAVIVRWQDDLAAVYLNTRDPAESLEKLKKVGEHTFRRVREDDGSLGETVVFEVDEDGTVLRLRQHSFLATRVR